MAVASSTSMASTTVLLHRLPATKQAAHFTTFPILSISSSIQLKQITGPRRSPEHHIRASSSDETSAIDANELFTDLKEKWDAIENKSTVLLYGGGAISALWLASIVIGAINSIPLLPKIMELVGLGYTGWFVFRYLIFKSSRKELASDIEALKMKISGPE